MQQNMEQQEIHQETQSYLLYEGKYVNCLLGLRSWVVSMGPEALHALRQMSIGDFFPELSS